MDYQDLLSRFGAPTEEPDGGYLAVCPGHQDSRPSLRIWRGDDGKVRLTCRAGCGTAHVIAAAGLSWPQLFGVKGDGPTVQAARPVLVDDVYLTALSEWLDSLPLASTMTDHADYLLSRFGLDAAAADAAGVRAWEPSSGPAPLWVSSHFQRHPRVVVPMLGFDGVPRGAQGRDISGACPIRWVGLTNPKGAHWAKHGYFPADESGPAVVCEGMSDPLTVLATGVSSLGIRGASLVSSPELVAEIADGLRDRDVFVCGDSDQAGQTFNRVFADALRPHGITARPVPIPSRLGPKADLTTWYGEAPSTFAAALAVRTEPTPAPAPTPPPLEGLVTTSVERAEDSGAVTKADGEEAAEALAGAFKRFGPGDVSHAYALVEWTGGRIRHATGLGFFVWTGRIWERGETRVRQEIHRMAAALMLGGRADAARAFTTSRMITDTIKELQSVQGVHIEADRLDAHLNLLSFANGVVDLRTGSLRPHDKDDLITASLEIDYRPEAECPRWESFMSEIMPGMPTMPGYLQRLLGYGITGETSEQCFAVLFGKGANGKSVMCDTIADIFKQVTQDTPFSTFEEKASGGIPNDLAALRDARLVTASEGESGKPMSESVIKKTTGDKNMTARFLKQEFFTFTPRFLVLMATNHKPQFRGQDDGLWRRVKLVPFRRYFAPSERDYGLDAKLLSEREGIAAWVVRGAMEWYRSGLQDPEEIQAATQDYRETSNPLDGFIPGIYEIDKASDCSVRGAEFYLDYKDWCEAEGLPVKDQWRRNTLYRHVEDMGAGKRKTNDGIRLFGIRKVPIAADPVEQYPDTPDIFKG